MRRNFKLSLLVFTTFLIHSCVEEFEPSSKNESVSIQFNMNLLTGSSANKIGIPDCSDSDPAFLEIKYDNKVFMTPFSESQGAENTLFLELGTYTVNEVNILDADLNIIYQVPNKEDERFDLTGYVNISTPFEINVTLFEREYNLDAVCFTPIELGAGSAVSVINLLEFQPLYYMLPLTNNGCFDELQLTYYSVEVLRFSIDNYSRTSEVIEFVPVPLPIEINTDGGGYITFNLLKDGEAVFTTAFFEYNEDGIITVDEVIDASQISCP